MGQMWSALMGSLQISCCLTGTFGGTPVNLLLFSQKCQGVPFSPSCQNSFCSGTISVDPICPQPSYVTPTRAKTSCPEATQTGPLLQRRAALAGFLDGFRYPLILKSWFAS